MNARQRYDREIVNSRESIRQVANGISAQLQRVLTTTELSDLMIYIAQHSQQNWTGYTVPQVRQALVVGYLNSRFTENGRRAAAKSTDLVDVHEILKSHIGTTEQESDFEYATNVDETGEPIDLKDLYDTGEAIKPTPSKPSSTSHLTSLDNVASITKMLSLVNLENISGILGKRDDTAVQALFNPQATHRKNYILLDSRYRDTSQDQPNAVTIMQFSWNFLAKSSVNQPGGVNSLGDVQNLVSVGCPDIRIPYESNILVNAYKRVTMLINEFSGQSYIGQEGRRFHFMFSAELDNNMISCTALADRTSVFEFAKPVTQIDTITLSFGAPLEPVVFDMDRQLMAVTYANPAIFTAPQEHNLQTGDQVYITTFTTNDPATDHAIIANVNAANGYNIFVIDDYSFKIPDLDLSTTSAPITPLNILVYFGSKRILVPLELKYIASNPAKTTP